MNLGSLVTNIITKNLHDELTSSRKVLSTVGNSYSSFGLIIIVNKDNITFLNTCGWKSNFFRTCSMYEAGFICLSTVSKSCTQGRITIQNMDLFNLGKRSKFQSNLRRRISNLNLFENWGSDFLFSGSNLFSGTSLSSIQTQIEQCVLTRKLYSLCTVKSSNRSTQHIYGILSFSRTVQCRIGNLVYRPQHSVIGLGQHHTTQYTVDNEVIHIKNSHFYVSFRNSFGSIKKGRSFIVLNFSHPVKFFLIYFTRINHATIASI